MWLKNKTTGVKWEVIDKELIKRLSKDENYEEIKIDKNIDDITETRYNNMKKDELLELAKTQNIEVNEKMIRKDIIKKIKKSTKK